MNNEIVMVGNVPYYVKKRYKNGSLSLQPCHVVDDMRGDLSNWSYQELLAEVGRRKREEINEATFVVGESQPFFSNYEDQIEIEAIVEDACSEENK